MDLTSLSAHDWWLAVVAAIGMGISKAGFSGMSLVHVLVFAFIFGARDSTGIVLPLLIVGDVLAVRSFRQHARWDYVRRMVPPTMVGVAAGYVLMGRIDDQAFKIVIGWLILGLTSVQVARMLRPGWLGDVPHSTAFAWTMGLACGVATMLANAAGPIFTIFSLAVALPKLELVGTSAWFFLIINVLKLPFSAALGLITPTTLLLNLTLVPAVLIGIGVGRWLTRQIPQEQFNALLLAFAAIAAARMIGLW